MRLGLLLVAFVLAGCGHTARSSKPPAPPTPALTVTEIQPAQPLVLKPTMEDPPEPELPERIMFRVIWQSGNDPDDQFNNYSSELHSWTIDEAAHYGVPPKLWLKLATDPMYCSEPVTIWLMPVWDV